MNVEDIMLDLRCVDLGLPPLSGGSRQAALLIMRFEPRERRAVSRKIRKLCKKFINSRVSRLRGPIKDARKSILEKRLSIKSDSQLFIKQVLVRRIDFIIVHLNRDERRSIYGKGK